MLGVDHRLFLKRHIHMPGEVRRDMARRVVSRRGDLLYLHFQSANLAALISEVFFVDGSPNSSIQSRGLAHQSPLRMSLSEKR